MATAADLCTTIEDEAASADSLLSWNSFLSRTSFSSLSRAVFSDQQSQAAHGIGDVIRAVGSLNLRRYRYEELVREGLLGEGETYMVEKCTARKAVFAVKHLKINCAGDGDDRASRRRLKSVILEVHIMRHGPLKAHPNFPSVLGYGWNTRDSRIMPYILMEYAQMGTLRQYFKQRHLSPISTLARDIGILVGDVASALSALHKCGIVHGDVKIDNVLVFPSSDRPPGALAKLTDFGHSLIMNDKSRDRDNGRVRYGGTLIYNAPEVQNQDTYPIDPANLPKCDVWAFGLLLWEACIGGEEYLTYVQEQRKTTQAGGNDDTIKPAELLRLAKRSVPGGSLGIPMFLRVTLHKIIQEDPYQRAAMWECIPLLTTWHAPSLRGLEADLALHLEAPIPTYEMFRLENGREILWAHQTQIFQGLLQTHAENLAKANNSIAWQIALCYHEGFGTSRLPETAYHYAEMAKVDSHPLAMAFADLLSPRRGLNPSSYQNPYAALVSRLLRSTPISQDMPPLVKACVDGDSKKALNLLSDGECPNLATVDGCTAFHWLFMFEDKVALKAVADKLRSSSARLLTDAPFSLNRQVHSQWPLQLCGSPPSVAISVGCLDAVKALLSLGADPSSVVYPSGQFLPDDLRSPWTAIHLAVKYHCTEILLELLDHVPPNRLQSMNPPLACALSFSTSLELLAIHGTRRFDQLNNTIAVIREIHPLAAAAPNGMTALMQAIDFQDSDIVAALLEAEPDLAKSALHSLNDSSLFTFPIHFAAQIAARRDTSETLLVLQLINSYSDELNPSKPPPRDDLERTPLHLAVTGPSSLAAEWILAKRHGLLHVEDALGRTPIHCCASSANIDLLISKGADLNHTNKHGMTALHRVSYLGEVEMARSLLKHKPKLNLRNNQYGTPLHCAVISGSLDVVLALLDAGAPLNAVDRRGNSSIHVAARMNRHSILRILIQRGADITIKNHNGRDARNLAAATGQLGSVGALRILQAGWETRINKRILEDSPEERHQNLGFTRTAQEESLPPDFLWEDAKGDIVTQWQRNADLAPEGRGQIVGDDEEQGESFDEKDLKMIRYERTCESIMGTWDTRPHWAVADTMALVWVYFDDAIWQPPLSANIVEIMTRTANDLAEILKQTPTVGVVEKQKGNTEEQFIFSQNERDDLDDISDILDSISGTGSGTPQESDRHTIQASEADSRLECKIKPELAEKSPSIEEQRQPQVDFEFKASCHIAAIVAATKPASVLPGRNQTDLGELILWELRRMLSRKVTEEYRQSQVAIWPTLFVKFPQLRGFGLTPYHRWKDTRAIAAGRSSRTSTTTWLDSDALWRNTLFGGLPRHSIDSTSSPYGPSIDLHRHQRKSEDTKTRHCDT